MNTSSLVVVEPSSGELERMELEPPSSVDYSRPTICGTWMGRLRFGTAKHDWLYLQPSNEQLEEIRRLLTFGRGTLGRIGARKEDAFDRICRACLLAENRMNAFIQALRAARGEEKET